MGLPRPTAGVPQPLRGPPLAAVEFVAHACTPGYRILRSHHRSGLVVTLASSGKAASSGMYAKAVARLRNESSVWSSRAARPRAARRPTTVSSKVLFPVPFAGDGDQLAALGSKGSVVAYTHPIPIDRQRVHFNYGRSAPGSWVCACGLLLDAAHDGADAARFGRQHSLLAPLPRRSSGVSQSSRTSAPRSRSSSCASARSSSVWRERTPCAASVAAIGSDSPAS